MIKILLFMAVVCLSPPARSMEISPYFRDADSFTLARAIKLGTATEDSRLPGRKTPYVVEQKEKYECTSDAECSKKTAGYVCRSNKCVDPCAGVTCAAGKKCSAGSCVACAAGATDCKCSSPAVANGSGGCIDACSPNNCASTTPTCTRTGNGTTYSCACTSSSCGEGKQCSGGSCSNCAVNTQCTCPSGKVANGSGSCVSPTCSSNSDCGAGKQCSNAGTISASCTNCTANSQCTCPSGQLANGSGSCVKPVCYDNTPCGAGRQCIDPGKYNAKCDPCPSGTQCTCPSGQVADGSGGCGVAGCAGALAAARPDVAVAENASQLTTALASGKDTIAVTESFTTTLGSNTSIDIGTKKLVGPQYFAYVEGCKSAATPTLTVKGGGQVAITVAGGEVANMNFSYTDSNDKISVIKGSGQLKNISITANKVKNLVHAGTTLNMEGTNTLTSNDTSSQMVGQDAKGTLNINGPLTLKGKATYGIAMGSEAKMTIGSSGSLTSHVKDGFIGIDIDNKAVFTANGPIKFMEPFSSTIGYIAIGNTKVTLNASNNYIKTTYTGFMSTAGDITINGSTTIECVRKDNNTCTAIDMHETYSSSVNSLTVTAPVTVTGLTKSGDSSYDSLLYFVGGTINIKSTITSTTNIGRILLNAESGSITSTGAILGGHLFDRGYWCADSSCPIYAESGARLKVGGTCRKATSRKVIPKAEKLKTPPSIFSSGC